MKKHGPAEMLWVFQTWLESVKNVSPLLIPTWINFYLSGNLDSRHVANFRRWLKQTNWVKDGASHG